MDQRIFELDAFADGKQGRVVSVATAEGGVGGFAGINQRGSGDDSCDCAAPLIGGADTYRYQTKGGAVRRLVDRESRSPARTNAPHARLP